MTPELSKKVEQLKNSFSVEGALLIKSNRFTQDELDELFKNRGTTHESHFYHLKKNMKTFSDQEISDQIETMLNNIVFKEQDLIDKMNSIFSESSFVDIISDKKSFIDKVYKLVGWDKFTPIDRTFWTIFGSAPIGGLSKSNTKLMTLKDKYGACAMEDIFGYKFSSTYYYTYTIQNVIDKFDVKWNKEFNFKKEKEKVYSSPYKDLDDLEENITVKKIKEESKKFYLDKTKSFKERVKVFNEHGKFETYVFSPNNSSLKKIFDIFGENDVERHQKYDSVSIVEWWIENLSEKKCKIDYSRNHYHPSLKQSKRKYKPSKIAIDRLYKFYVEKLFLEGVGSFEWDW